MSFFKKPKQGFSLSEVMIAAAFLLIALATLLRVFVACGILNESNYNLIIAMNDAQHVLEQIRGLTYSAVDAYTPPAFNNLTNETITITRTTVGSNLKEVIVNVSWTERRNRQISLYTRIAG